MIAVLLFSALLSLPPSPPVSAEALGTVKYEVRYIKGAINTKVADATISLEKGTWNQQSVLHSHATVRASSVFRLFLNSEYVADTYLASDGQEPVYYMNPVKRGGKEGKFECTYDKGAKLIRSEFVRPPADPVNKTFTLDGRTMDLLSLLQFVRFHNFTVGSPVSMHLLMGGESVAATLTCQGSGDDRYPGTERFLLKMKDRGLMENGSGNEITVWRTKGGSRRIVCLETALSTGVMVVTVKE
jgi:hypothetical protein